MNLRSIAAASVVLSSLAVGSSAHALTSAATDLTDAQVALRGDSQSSSVSLSDLTGCAGSAYPGSVSCTSIDDDHDGYNACDDCDDENPDINPGASEICDGIDNNCDEQADEGGVCAPVCVTIQRGTLGTVQDAPIHAATPDLNLGAYVNLYTGYKVDAGFKMSLVQFSLNMIPFGAIVTSAEFGISQTYSTVGSTVRVHRALAPWAESTVTWNNFHRAYDSEVLGSFESFVNDFGWRTVDVTSTVQSWVSGANENDGFLLEEDIIVQHAYRSSETSVVTNRPYLTVCYYGGEG